MKESTREKVKMITEKLEQGVKDVFTSDRYMEYLQVMGRFHRYSANNVMLITLQMPFASRVAGFKKWNELERHVKKGEKAITILAPTKRKVIREVVNDKGEKEMEEHQYTSFLPVSVFDVSQTEGKELPTICPALMGDAEEEMIEKVKKISPVPVHYEDIPGSAKGYFSHDGYIAIREGMSGQQTLKTLLHEIAHSLLHGDEGEEKDADRETKEVQAESTAYTVCSYLGIDTSDYSFGYIASWSRGREVKELQKSLEVIRKTASGMIEQLEAA